MSNGQSNRVVGVEEVLIDTLDGLDLSFITGSEGQERLEASYSSVKLETTTQLLQLINVERTKFDGNGGGDEVVIEDMGNLDVLRMFGSEAIAFLKDHSVAMGEFSTLEANTVDDAMASYDLESVDYLYRLRGNWSTR